MAERGRASRRGLTALWVLLLLPPLAMLGAGAVQAPSAGADEEAIMLALRDAINRAEPAWSLDQPGWQPGNPAHHCTWLRVHCDAAGFVVRISDRAKRNGTNVTVLMNGLPGPLLPQLAELRWLTYLEIEHLWPNGQTSEPNGQTSGKHWTLAALHGGIPAEWALPGAFPSLQRLDINVYDMEVPGLPDFQPGAMPRLRELTLSIDVMNASLPPSWGSSPDILPSLEVLQLTWRFEGPLPPQWAFGFVGLQFLALEQWQPKGIPSPVLAAKAAAGASPGGGRRLPAAWAAGFPRLSALALMSLDLTGTIPAAWSLDGNTLTGTLPSKLYFLKSLEVSKNSFSGTLPDAWAATQIQVLGIGSNQLTGPAFPPTWIASGGMKWLTRLDLQGNTGLTGSLPDNLSWPHLHTLHLAGTGVKGPVPHAWCRAPFRLNVLTLSDGSESIQTPCTEASGPIGLFLPSGIEKLVEVDYWKSDWISSYTSSYTAPDGVLVWRHSQWPVMTAAVLLTGVLPLGALLMYWWRRAGRGMLQRQQRQQVAEAGQPLVGSSPQGAAVGDGLELADWHEEQRKAGEVQEGEQEGTKVLGEDGRALSPVTVADVALLRRRKRVSAKLADVLKDWRGWQMIQVLPLPAAALHRLGGAQPTVLELAGDIGSRGSGSSGNGGGITDASGFNSMGSSQRAGRDGSNSSSVKETTSGGLDGSDFEPALRAQASECESLIPLRSRSGSILLPGQEATSEHGGSSTGRHSAGRVSGGRGGSEGSGKLRSRQWGLPTQSIRLAPGDLEFVYQDDGELNVLGQGSFGIVYHGSMGGLDVAIKVIELLPTANSGMFWREVGLLQKCIHEHVVPLYGVVLKGSLLMLVTKLMQGGSLAQALRDPYVKPQLRWADRGRQVAIDIAEALAHLHTQLRVFHSDLKAGNVLLTKDLRASIADLGIAQVVTNSTLPVAFGGSYVYSAPEQLLGQPCTLAADMYSFGLLLAELLTQQPLKKRGLHRLPRAPDECPQSVVDLIEDCLQVRPEKRPTSQQALQQLTTA